MKKYLEQNNTNRPMSPHEDKAILFMLQMDIGLPVKS